VTLVEIAVTLLIIGILLGVGVPSYVSFTQTNRLVTATNDVITDITYARSEAIKNRAQVGLCTTNPDGTACDSTGSWGKGWAVFLDSDNSTSWTAGDNILKVHQAISEDVTFTVNTGSATPGASITLIALAPTALTAGNMSASYRLCSKKLGIQRRIFLDITGRTTTVKESC
jgi:type IV fimbrial biogenesis protein FimT